MKHSLIVLIIVAVIGGEFYLYLNPPLATPKDQFSSTPKVSPTEPGLLHDTEHMYAEKIEIKGNDEYQGDFTKEFFIPKVRNISDKAVTDSIDKELSFATIVGQSAEEIKQSSNGTTDSDYQVTYDKNDVLSLDIFVDFMGPYPSVSNTNYNFNLKTGKHVELSEIFYKKKIDALIKMLNLKLAANIKDSLDSARINNPDSKPGECSEDDINYQLEDNKRYDINYGRMSAEKLDYLITTKGVEFHYNFDFPHVILACEPDQVGLMSFKELKDYIRPDGFLGNEIK